jgi:hypothetical protein
MDVAIFWDIALCSPYANRCFGGDMLLRNVSSHAGDTALYPRRWQHLCKEQVHDLFAYLVKDILHRRGLN